MGLRTAVRTARVVAVTSAAVVGQGPGGSGGSAAGALVAIVFTAAGVVLISIIIKNIIISL